LHRLVTKWPFSTNDGENNDVDIVNLFCFTLLDAICEWGENFMGASLVYKFEKLEVTFYKCYWKVQTNEQMYMALQVIKQGGNEKVEVLWTYIEISKMPLTSSKW
jgi:hypothetical protein